MTRRLLTIVIVNYNVKHYLNQCLASLQSATKGIDAETVVVDNASTDGSVRYLRRRFPRTRIIESGANLGFAAANNIAIRRTDSKYVLLLNPDTIVADDTLRRAISFAEDHPKLGAAGVRMIGADGHTAPESRRGLPSPMTAFYKMTGLCAKWPQSHRFGRYYMSWLPWDEPQPIEVVSGAFCLLRREALDTAGLLDEDFFMYGEDIDLSYRILRSGWQNWYLPYPILHYKGESASQTTYRYVHIFYDAMLIFFRKHYGHLGFFVSIPIRAAIYAKAALELVSMKMKEMRDALWGIRPKRSHRKFVFIGGRAMLSHCRRLAAGLDCTAEFHLADSASAPQGHHQLTRLTEPATIVYDTAAYTYGQMLDLISRPAGAPAALGTFDCRSMTLVTQLETLHS